MINVHVLCASGLKTSKKNFRLSIRTYVRGFWRCRHNNFRRSWQIQTKFGEGLLCIKGRSGIEI